MSFEHIDEGINTLGFSLGELRDDWLEISGILPNPSVVTEIFSCAEIYSPESISDVIDLLVPVALAVGYINLDVDDDNTVFENSNHFLEKLMSDSESGDYAKWCVGIGISFIENLRAEESRFAQAAIRILDDESFQGDNNERYRLASIIAGETDEIFPVEKIREFLPLTSVEKIASSQQLVLESDVEAFMLNFARNLALVENENISENERLRAVINLEEILIPVMRMFGPRFEDLTDRARVSAWEFMKTKYPEFTKSIVDIQEYAKSIIDPLGVLLAEILSNTNSRISTSRVKSLGSTILKGLRKGIEDYEKIADILGYRIVAVNIDELKFVLKDLIGAFRYKNGSYKLLTGDYIIELGKLTDVSNPTTSPEDVAAIVLNIEDSNILYRSLGELPKMYASKPKESGYQTVYLNFIVREKGSNTNLGVEIQLVTEDMLRLNRLGKAVIGVYKSNPNSPEDLRRAEDLANGVLQRAEVFASGKHKLALKTQFKIAEYWPSLYNDLTKHFSVFTADGSILAVPRELSEFIPRLQMSQSLKYLESSLLALPVSNVSEVEFLNIVDAEMPIWLQGKTKLKSAISYAKQWHAQQQRRSGLNHYEGHVLPLALAYFVNIIAKGGEISQNDIITILLHDSIEDATNTSEKKRRTKTIRREFGDSVLAEIRLQTKQVKHSHETSEEIDANQSKRLNELDNEDVQKEIFKKCIDRIGNHIGDLVASVNLGHFDTRYRKYFDNSKSHYKRLFERYQDSKELWVVTEELFKAVEDDLTYLT